MGTALRVPRRAAASSSRGHWEPRPAPQHAVSTPPPVPGTCLPSSRPQLPGRGQPRCWPAPRSAPLHLPPAPPPHRPPSASVLTASVPLPPALTRAPTERRLRSRSRRSPRASQVPAPAERKPPPPRGGRYGLPPPEASAVRPPPRCAGAPQPPHLGRCLRRRQLQVTPAAAMSSPCLVPPALGCPAGVPWHTGSRPSWTLAGDTSEPLSANDGGGVSDQPQRPSALQTRTRKPLHQRSAPPTPEEARRGHQSGVNATR